MGFCHAKIPIPMVLEKTDDYKIEQTGDWKVKRTGSLFIVDLKIYLKKS